jgi:tetratricopeptide (TPR) repeat protein
MSNRFSNKVQLAGWLLGLLALVLPQKVSAHGELLIRIGALTRQIQASTNGLPQLYLQRGELYREDKNWDAAASDYSEAEKLDPNLPTVDFCRAKLLADRGQLDAARKMFDRAVGRRPACGDVRVARAQLLVQLGQRKAALLDFEAGLNTMTDPPPECFLDWARALRAEGRITEALRSLDLGIKKFGPVSTLQVYALDLELDQKSTNGALARLETIINSAPRKELWLARRGDIQVAAGMPLQARHSYEAALAAIKTLPQLLQKTPHTLALQSRVNAALARCATGQEFGQTRLSR